MAKFLDNSFLRSSENHWPHQRADQRGSPAHKLSPGSEPAETDSLDEAHKCIKLGRMQTEKRRREDGTERWEVSPNLPLGGQARTWVRSWGTEKGRPLRPRSTFSLSYPVLVNSHPFFSAFYVPSTGSSTLHTSHISSQLPSEAGMMIIPVSQMRKLSLREVNCLPQGNS